MAKTRALMTQTERDRISGIEDVEDIKRYQAITRVRGRIQDELTEDIQIFEGHHEGLLEELREVVCGDEFSFSPLGSKNISYGPSSRSDAAYVLRVGTKDGTVEIHLNEEEMYELWTEVQHTPWPDQLEGQEEVGDLRRRLVDLAMGADAETLEDALDALEPRWREL
jgi:hypothetical protein